MISRTPSKGANEVIWLSGVRTSGTVFGFVKDSTGEPIPTAVIDVARFKNGAGFTGSFTESQRIRSYKANFNGYFCLGDLPDGKYILRFGTDRLAFKHLVFRVNKKHGSKARPIKVELSVGT